MSEIHDRRRDDFERLFRQHAGTVTAWAQRRDTDAERAQDLVAETFMVAWRRLEDIPAGDERPWLLGVAGKIRANQLRGEHRRSRLVARLVTQLPDPPVLTVAHDIDPELTAALRELPPRDRELILLVAWDELTPAEAAKVVGCTAVAARVRLHRARRRLHALLPEHAARAVGAPGLLEDME